MKRKRVPLAELQETARVATQIALASWTPLREDLRSSIALGTRWDEDAVVFELYIPGERRADAIVLTEARMNAYDGQVEAVIVHDDVWRSIGVAV